MSILIRPGQSPDDLFYVKQQMLASLYYHKDGISNCWQNKGISRPVFMTEHGAVVDELFKVAEVLMAADSESPESYYGFLMFQQTIEGLIVHYAYTKKVFWKNGVQRKLFAKAGYKDGDKVIMTHLTKKGMDALKGRDLSKWTHNPYLAYFPVSKN
ncbi:MAG: hypothetical protein HC875_19165 [Anaerolineales bacterium]|nr:hypothetical protein [Anaerolineales bacterium]